MPLYPPTIGKLPLSNLGKRIRGVKVIELERGLSGQNNATPPVWDTNPNTGLWAYYPFEDGANPTSVVDVIGGGTNWTVERGVAIGNDILSVTGKNGNAIEFPEGNDPDTGARLIQGNGETGSDETKWEFDGTTGTLTSFTIRLWFKVASLSPAGFFCCLLNKRDVTAGYGLYLNDTNLVWNVYTTTGPESSVINIAEAGINLGQWNYILAYHSFGVPGTIGLKLNGAAVSTTAHSNGITSDPTAVKIGALAADTLLSPGHVFQIDELAIWSRVLSANDITHDYNAGNGKFWPTLA